MRGLREAVHAALGRLDAGLLAHVLPVMRREEGWGSQKPRLFDEVTLAGRIHEVTGLEGGGETAYSHERPTLGVQHSRSTRGLPDVGDRSGVVSPSSPTVTPLVASGGSGVVFRSLVALSGGIGSPAFSHLPAPRATPEHWRDDRLPVRRLSSV